MKGVKIVKIAPVSRDSRGETRELFTGLPGRQMVLYKRKKGAVFGRHFHKGIDPSKNPERMFIISGRLEFFAYDGQSGETLRTKISGNTYLTIAKGIYHEMRALSDVFFIEYRSTIFDKENPDTFPQEDYDEYIKSGKGGFRER